MSDPAELVVALRARGWTLGVAESLTGGALSARIVDVPGASAVLLGAVVAYATPVKQRLLGVDAELLAAHGPVHPLVAEQMAVGVRDAVTVDGRPADVGIATTGVAGPGPADGHPAGTVHIGIATPAGAQTVPLLLSGDRAAIRIAAVDAALSAAVLAVREYRPEGCG